MLGVTGILKRLMRLQILNAVGWQDLGSRLHTSGPQVGPKKLNNSVLGIADVCVNRPNSVDMLLLSSR